MSARSVRSPRRGLVAGGAIQLAVLVALAATGTLGAWAWNGVVPLATGLIGSCPAYTLLGFSTCPMNKS